MPRSGPGPTIGWPANSIWPPLAFSKPPRMCRNVLLPQPEGPTIETNSPSSMLSEKLSIAWMALPSWVKRLSSAVTRRSPTVLLPVCARRPLFRQIAEIDILREIGALLLESGAHLQILHLLQPRDIEPCGRLVIGVFHLVEDLGIDAHHLAVD